MVHLRKLVFSVTLIVLMLVTLFPSYVKADVQPAKNWSFEDRHMPDPYDPNYGVYRCPPWETNNGGWRDLRGDCNPLDGDGTVDVYDSIFISNYYGSTPEDPNWSPYAKYADINGDYVVDIWDAILVSIDYGEDAKRIDGSYSWYTSGGGDYKMWQYLDEDLLNAVKGKTVTFSFWYLPESVAPDGSQNYARAEIHYLSFGYPYANAWIYGDWVQPNEMKWHTAFVTAGIPDYADYVEIHIHGTSDGNPNFKAWIDRAWLDIDTDSDGDGLNDGEEVNTYGTNPTNSDTDGDGWQDDAEISFWMNIKGLSATAAGGNARNSDTDGDGMLDGREALYYPTVDPASADAGNDPDNDNISNKDELNKYYLNATTSITYNVADSTYKARADRMGPEGGGMVTQTDACPYMGGEMENVYVTQFDMAGPQGAEDPFDGGWSLHVYQIYDTSYKFYVTVKITKPDGTIDDDVDFPWLYYYDDDKNEITVIEEAINGHEGHKKFIVDHAVGKGAYWFIYRVDPTGGNTMERDTMTVTANYEDGRKIPIIWVCPTSEVTYSVSIKFLKTTTDPIDLYFRGHTNPHGYLSDMQVTTDSGTKTVPTETALGNTLYKFSSFMFHLGTDFTSASIYTLTFNYHVTGLAAMQFHICTNGWKNPAEHDMDRDGYTDYEEADLGSHPEHPDMFIEIDYMADCNPTGFPALSYLVTYYGSLTTAMYPNGITVHIWVDDEVDPDGCDGTTPDWSISIQEQNINENQNHDRDGTHLYVLWGTYHALEVWGIADHVEDCGVMICDYQIQEQHDSIPAPLDNCRTQVFVHEIGHCNNLWDMEPPHPTSCSMYAIVNADNCVASPRYCSECEGGLLLLQYYD